MKRLAAAIRFLTFVPVPQACAGDAATLAAGLVWFPVVGLLIGGAMGLLTLGLREVLPPLPLAAMLVAAMVLVSRGLHLEGLADTADGFLSSRPRAQILEIMKDSRAGAMGVIAVVLVLLAKFSLVASVVPAHLWRIVILAPLVGRCAHVLTMAALPYARAEGGLATVFAAALGGRRRRLGLSLWAVALPVAAGALLLGWLGVVAALAAFAAIAAFDLLCRRKIGGYTGDTLGAVCELAELAPLLVAVLWQ